MSLIVLEETLSLSKVRDEETGDEYWISRDKLERLMKKEEDSRRHFARLLEDSKGEKVEKTMSDNAWRTMKEIGELSDYGPNESGLSATVRSLRKRGHNVEKRRTDSGEYEYRIAPRI